MRNWPWTPYSRGVARAAAVAGILAVGCSSRTPQGVAAVDSGPGSASDSGETASSSGGGSGGAGDAGADSGRGGDGAAGSDGGNGYASSSSSGGSGSGTGGSDSGRGGTGDGGEAPPSFAASAGMQTLTFDEEWNEPSLTSTSTMLFTDATSTHYNQTVPGYKWYANGCGVWDGSTQSQPESSFSLLADGGLELRDTIGVEWAFSSACNLYNGTSLYTAAGAGIISVHNPGSLPTAITRDDFAGQAFANGWYIESSLAFNDSDVVQGSSWPAFWSDPIGFFANDGSGPGGGMQWPGQSSYVHWAEDDFFEWFIQNNPHCAATVHDWSGPNRSQPVGNPSNNQNQLIGTDGWAQFSCPHFSLGTYHTVGQLWTPPGQSGTGTLTNYFDGAEVNTVSWSTAMGSGVPADIQANYTPAGFDFSVMDTMPRADGGVGQAMAIIFGGIANQGTGRPVRIQYVRVWQ